MALLLLSLLYILCKFINGAPSQPNFIFILADDQDLVFDSMSVMSNTLKYIKDEGMTFNNAFIATPICCPSRTETISGRAFHNIKNVDSPLCMHIAAQYNVFNNTNSMFQTFHRNGYNTGSFGKLTNDMPTYFCNDNPPMLDGFTRVNCPCYYNDFYGTKYVDYDETTSNYTLYTLPVDENTYETSYVGNASLKWISEQLQQQDTNNKAAPFIAWIGPHAPQLIYI